MHAPRSRLSRDFWLMWSATALSNLGDGIRLGALPLLTVTITRDPLPVTLVTALTFLPWVVFGAFGGAVVDRHDRRTLIVVGQLVRGVAVAGLTVGVVSDRVSLAAIYVVAFVIGAGEVVVDTASQAAIPRLAPVGSGGLELANGRIASAQLVTNEVLGTPLGALLFAAAAAVPFGLDAATFLAGGLLVSVIRTPLQGERGGRSGGMLADVREGFRFLLQHPFLRPMMLATGLLNVSVTAMSSLFVLLVVEVYDAPDWTFGVLIGAGAAGGLIGSFTAERVSLRLGRGPAMLVSSGFGLGLMASMGLTSNVVVGSALYFASAVAALVGNIVIQSVRQQVTPDELLGRVVASYRIVGMGGIPVGAVVGGVVAGVADIRTAYAVAACIGLVAWALIRRGATSLARPPER